MTINLQYNIMKQQGMDFFQELDVLFIKDNASCYLSEPYMQHWVTFFEETRLGGVIFLQALGVRFCHFSR